MKVFCRFAPPPADRPPTATATAASAAILGVNTSTGGHCCISRGSTEATLLMRAEGPSSAAATTAAASAITTGTRVSLADPVTLSKASFSCDGVFLPSVAAAATSGAMAAQQQQHLYDATCRCLLEPAPLLLEQKRRWDGSAPVPMAARRIYLAYGQTASGKTYSLFGETPTRPGAEGLSPSAGVVPRYLHDVFYSRNGTAQHRLGGTDSGSAAEDVFVDLSCFEVYSEVVTDLVALSVVLSASDFPYSTSTAGAARGSAGRRLSSKAPTDAAAAVPHSLRSSDLRRQLPVWVAHHLYCSEQQPDDADSYAQEELLCTRGESSVSEATARTAAAGAAAAPFVSSPTLSRFLKTEYKATEKQKVLRSLERARCTTFTEAQAVLQALLALRQACTTSRNQSSSRGHLVLCVQVYARAASDSPAGEWMMQHETAFVDLAGSESGKLTDVDVADVRASQVVHHQPKRRTQATTSAASSSRASSQHSRILLDTSMQSDVSSKQSGISISTTTTTNSAYHRSLLRPSPEEDKKAAQARRRRETRSINASLLALRKVFRALYEATHLSHIAVTRELAATTLTRRPPLRHAPFKDSALTAILEPFLVPQLSAAPPPSSTSPSSPSSAAAVHVVLLVCCSSRSVDFFETVSSLRLGAEASAVNPEVVLRALPVQQRERQHQPQLYACVTHSQSHHNSISCRHHGGSTCAVRVPHVLFRSASAPNQRLALTGDEDEVRKEDTFSGCASAPGISAAADTRLRRTSAACSAALSEPHDRCRPGEVIMSAADASRLRDEALQYKEMAQKLYKQCKSLCESYDECVDELRWYRVALSERDARVAELEAELAEVSHSHGADSSRRLQKPLPKSLQPRTPTESRNSATACGSPAARTPHSLPLQYRNREAAAEDESPKVIPTANNGGRLEENAAPAESATALVAARRMRATPTSSTAREDSERWMVSVSPFSTASLAAGTVVRTAVVPDDVERLEEAVGVDGSSVSVSDDTRWPRGRSSRSNSSSSSTGGQRCRSTIERQQQHARCVMNTFLARQIFPPDAPVKPTLSTSPSRASSSSPLLPTLSACGTVATASSTAQQQRQTRSHINYQENERGPCVLHEHESEGDGSPLTGKVHLAAGEPSRAKESIEGSAAIAATSAFLSAPLRQLHNTPRSSSSSSSADATASSSLKGRDIVSAVRSACDSVTVEPEADSAIFPSSAVPAAYEAVAPAASVSTLPATATWTKNLKSRSAVHTVSHDSPLQGTSRQAIAMSMDRNGELPHAEAAAGGDEEDAVEEVVIQLKEHEHCDSPLILAATCQSAETVRRVEKNRAPLMPPCRNSSLGAVASVPVTRPTSPLTQVYYL
ncbi:putative kinesin [Leishmania braziliensis MHOM/BR/75/M2904]|uniref:Kinesin n=2 Tax=Leishmania braziliensis TaxID=5660 RepID=A4H5K3_LEIBR|nr:putative kinesin [Leishmania braziliensis MHOM/BR/75/M2904]CAJ2467374.1 unnamed protein product [Leishmania braziliensis]CAM41767.2 putative kinesin [Leishmania braziliensis MHOM/BR/75/M2904]